MRPKVFLPVRHFEPRVESASVVVASSKQILTGLLESHISPALVHLEPAPLDRQLQPGGVFSRGPLEIEQKRPLISSMWIRPS